MKGYNGLHHNLLDFLPLSSVRHYLKVNSVCPSLNSKNVKEIQNFWRVKRSLHVGKGDNGHTPEVELRIT